jgi:hypothetical protein
MGRRRIHTQGGTIDLSVLGQPQTTPMSMLSHPALMSNVGIHNVLQGVHSPLHPNTLRSTGGDLKGDLKHLAYHHLHSGKRGHDLMDDIYHSGRQLLGVGLYAQPHGGDLLDSIYQTGRHLIDSGIDGKPLVDMLLHHSGRQGGSGVSAEPMGGKLNAKDIGNKILNTFSHMTDPSNIPTGFGLSAEPMGGSILETLGNKLGDRAIDMALSRMFGGQIPAPPSRSPITDPSLIGGKMRRMRGGNELTGGGKTPFLAGLPRPSASQVAQQTAGFNALDKGLEAFEGKLIGGGKAPRKGRFVKGSAEAKAYMASIRKKK